MRRLSLRTLVILVPLTCGVLLSAWSYRRNEQREAVLQAYRLALAAGDEIPVTSVVAAFGEEETKAFIDESAKSSPLLVFDGVSRVAQIVRDENGDGILLYGFGHGSSHYHAPRGGNIQEISFTNQHVVVSVYGKLKMGSFECSIEESKPDRYQIEWLPETKPDVVDLYDLIWERHQNDAARREEP